MKQYLDVKKKHKDEILLFRLGDFYEMFFDDAVTASKELHLTLTKRASTGNNVPMCGFPHHVSNSYISKLIDKGYKVAICDQVEDPKLAKTIVKREVTKVITPGTFTDSEYLDSSNNNYLMSVYVKNLSIFISYLDYSTGEIYITEKTFLNRKELNIFFVDECYRINPSEILINKQKDVNFNKILKNIPSYINFVEDLNLNVNDFDEYIDDTNIYSELINLKNNRNINDLISIKILFSYVIKTQKDGFKHLNFVIYYNSDDNLLIDENSKINLELVKGLNTNSKKDSLLGVLDNCKTSMGSRTLKKWIEKPLKYRDEIEYRLNIVEKLNEDFILLDNIIKELNEIYDIERLSVKISNSTITPKDLIALLNSLKSIKNIKFILKLSNSEILSKLSDQINPLEKLKSTIENTIIDDPPANFEEKQFIKKGFSKELDDLFDMSTKAKKWILEFENEQREKTGIKNLRVKYNKILGYFIEITKSFVDKVPSTYIRKQTLVGSERYFSLELKEMEAKLLSSRDDALALQLSLFDELKKYLSDNIKNIQELSKVVSLIDVLTNFSDVSIKNNYTKPEFNQDEVIEIKDGRHPIIEFNFTDELFVPNDTVLDNKENLIHIITGPNMAGKSTYMRQVALIVIMAQMGCYVPASKANLSIVDKIFTRIGASDNLSKGESTFMVEMKEVANILNNATSSSLIILDEVGRGTSTYDGISLAWAIVEFIVENIKAKTLFATHYHELVDLAKKYDCISNLTIQVQEQEDTIIFLRKIIDGYTNNSYGIEVAKLAGINEVVLNRSREILDNISEEKSVLINKPKQTDIKSRNKYSASEKILKDISNININNLSPLEAINILNTVIERIRNTNEY
ncbi:DNA mismatch repair protein MutS [Peptoniphilus sp. ING2-D1G]|nr:DNA mismatch repair protein MutS [Peptoniphilus sp. ING2-D1G]